MIIKAKWVAAGIGLPAVWCGHVTQPLGHAVWRNWFDPTDDKYVSVVDLSDHQTVFGLAIKLDEWETACEATLGLLPQSKSWLTALAHAHGTEGYEPLLRMVVARIELIGLDHYIRRLLGDDLPKPGTLADVGLQKPHEQWWRYDARMHGGAFIEWQLDGQFIGSAGIPGGAPCLPNMAGHSDTVVFLKAIAEALDGR